MEDQSTTYHFQASHLRGGYSKSSMKYHSMNSLSSFKKYKNHFIGSMLIFLIFNGCLLIGPVNVNRFNDPCDALEWLRKRSFSKNDEDASKVILSMLRDKKSRCRNLAAELSTSLNIEKYGEELRAIVSHILTEEMHDKNLVIRLLRELKFMGFDPDQLFVYFDMYFKSKDENLKFWASHIALDLFPNESQFIKAQIDYFSQDEHETSGYSLRAFEKLSEVRPKEEIADNIQPRVIDFLKRGNTERKLAILKTLLSYPEKFNRNIVIKSATIVREALINEEYSSLYIQDFDNEVSKNLNNI